MKKALSLAAILAVTGFTGAALAGPPENEFYIGMTGGLALPLANWNLGPNAAYHTLTPKPSAQAGLRLGFEATRHLTLEVGAQALYLRLPNDRRDPALMYNADLLFHRDIGAISPFIVVGLGAYQSILMDHSDLGLDKDLQFHIGIGARSMVTDWCALRLEARDVSTDGFASFNTFAGNNLEVTAGLDLYPVSLFSAKDADKDGVPDKSDMCPNQQGTAATKGCPDQDGDAIADADDACANQAGEAALKGCPDQDRDLIADHDDACPADAGVAAAKGCPDQDGDAVADKADACPTENGPALLKGCPDKDGDTLADKDDACPAESGPASLKGCPDKDGDALADTDDACPAEKGPAKLKGCPDQDGDLVADRDDKCPTVRGLVEQQGCLPKEVEKFTGTIEGIKFASGKAVLLPTSFKVLNRAAKVLEKFPTVRLAIEGHSDNIGNAEMNKKLSAERAAAVRAYLEARDIDGARLTSEGFGSERPVADNKTAKGRAQNRRVEFNLIAQ